MRVCSDLTISILCLGLCLAGLGCGSDDGETADPGADVGEDCESGSDCKGGLLCYVETEGSPGKCEALPDGCTGELECASTCLDEVKARCADSSSCFRFGSDVTIACLPPGS